jgi:hypothetical protein
MTARTKLLLGILAALSAALVWVVRSGRGEGPDGDESREERAELPSEWKPLPVDRRPAAVDDLQSQTGIEIFAATGTFTAPGGKVTGGPPVESEIQTTALAVANELRRYPESFLKATGLRAVVLARQVTREGRRFAGLASRGSHAFLMNTEYAPEVRRQTMHHELFHLFDRTYDEAAWRALNPPGIDYDPKEARTYVPGVGAGIDRSLYAFISRYAMSSPHEDRAELFGFLMTDRAAVLGVATHDRVLRAKIDRLELDIRAKVPEMDDAFWASR